MSLVIFLLAWSIFILGLIALAVASRAKCTTCGRWARWCVPPWPLTLPGEERRRMWYCRHCKSAWT
jgi:hypothetical protein